jgi:hypothetical protein
VEEILYFAIHMVVITRTFSRGQPIPMRETLQTGYWHRNYATTEVTISETDWDLPL